LEQKRRPTVLPVFEGSSDEINKDLEENLTDCEGLFIVYGNASKIWVRAALRRYFKFVRPRQTQPYYKTILFVRPPSKSESELGASVDDFKRVYCDGGITVERVQNILEELRL
jgi:hypothetical protein